VGGIGVVFVVVVNVELAASNDCAVPEPGVCFESAGMGRAPPSAAAMLSESKPVIASYCYNVIMSARTKLRVRC
jgi:hypothetical protein